MEGEAERREQIKEAFGKLFQPPGAVLAEILDSQCGLKGFTRSAAKIRQPQRLGVSHPARGWVSGSELLFRRKLQLIK